MSRKLLTPEEAAERLGMSRKAIYNMSHERRIETVKIGRCLRIREQEIERLIAEGTRRPVA